MHERHLRRHSGQAKMNACIGDVDRHVDTHNHGHHKNECTDCRNEHRYTPSSPSYEYHDAFREVNQICAWVGSCNRQSPKVKVMEVLSPYLPRVAVATLRGDWR